ncbi:MAG: hypothetical protein CO105_04270 [Comamonadaceae bacterium CG_4_9_14_3_um_filter_60_33]|nr:MAG: hypothetical protein AUK51_13865 [Comamonadaceae bacterium CG2_30_59_20]PIY30157.1 MAG: hypothetical protein COZ09_01020 [Comamonadaceae bacterium CG_4_10_14_3_um_filter_60_42]PJB45275.1 MAG: hypothetical protein CO105_04270 [Comamonadaceae bacterium CG_4_9_14_3_um_filter_60_33]
MTLSTPQTCPPPAGYETWLDYAVVNMDTRSAYHEYLFELSAGSSPACDREAMRVAVLAELDALRLAAQVADTFPALLRSGIHQSSQ